MMNKSSISQIPQCIRQITHNAPFSNKFLLQKVHCGIWVWCIVGFVQWVYWLTKNLFLDNKSEFLGIKRSWIENTYTIDMETLFLFTANKNAFFNHSGTRLAQRAFWPGNLHCLSVIIQCNHVWWPFSTKLRNVALILYTLYLKHFLINMSFYLNYARGWPRE